MFDVRICPHKLLLQHREELEKTPFSAVLCSSEPLKESLYRWISRQIRLEFIDTTVDRMDAFRPEQAAEIADFVRNTPENSTIFFCCDSGVSRSSALAAACLRFSGGDEMEVWTDPEYHPNPLVYRLQCEAFGIRVSAKELKEKLRISDNALTAAIRHSQRRKTPQSLVIGH